MECVAAAEPAHVELLRAKAGRRPTICEHRPLLLLAGHGDDDRPRVVDDRPYELDTAPLELRYRKLRRRPAAALRDQLRLGAARHAPRRDVRRLAARADRGRRGRVVARCEGRLEADDDVDREISERAHEHS